MTAVTGYQLQHLTHFWRRAKRVWPSAVLGNGSLLSLPALTVFSQLAKGDGKATCTLPKEGAGGQGAQQPRTKAPSHTSPLQGQGSNQLPQGLAFLSSHPKASRESVPGRLVHKAAGQCSSQRPYFSMAWGMWQGGTASGGGKGKHLLQALLENTV